MNCWRAPIGEQFAPQPPTRLGPIPLYRAAGNRKGRGDLVDIEAPEKPHFDDLIKACIVSLHAAKRITERARGSVGLRGEWQVRIPQDPTRVARRIGAASAVDEDAAHDDRGQRQEMTSVLKLDRVRLRAILRNASCARSSGSRGRAQASRLRIAAAWRRNRRYTDSFIISDTRRRAVSNSGLAFPWDPPCRVKTAAEDKILLFR